MKIIVDQDQIGYHVPNKLYNQFERAQESINVDTVYIDDPAYLRYTELKERVLQCKSFVVDKILTGDD